MDFEEAVKAMKEGKKVRMSRWADKGVYYYFGSAGKMFLGNEGLSATESNYSTTGRELEERDGKKTSA